MSDYASDEVETLREALDAALAEIERLKQALRQAADEPSIDRARAIADAVLGS